MTKGREESGRDVALRVCRCLLAAVGKHTLGTIQHMARKALRLEAGRVRKYEDRREEEKRRDRSWERQYKERAREERARKSRLGKLLALHNKVQAFIKAHYTVKRGRNAGCHDHEITVKLRDDRLTATIEKKVFGTVGWGYSKRALRSDLWEQAKSFLKDAAKLRQMRKVFGGRLVKGSYDDKGYGSEPVTKKYKTLTLVWRKS